MLNRSENCVTCIMQIRLSAKLGPFWQPLQKPFYLFGSHFCFNWRWIQLVTVLTSIHVSFVCTCLQWNGQLVTVILFWWLKMNVYSFVVGFCFFVFFYACIFLFDLCFPQRLQTFSAFVPGVVHDQLRVWGPDCIGQKSPKMHTLCRTTPSILGPRLGQMIIIPTPLFQTI